ncbi:restriction endonuclease subunit S [Vibrio cionasavignyae]|uniref:restriction endonuclease subunit S n=1 Tax=Vibrio cionasavignyae TaxID=2910252 RepID=UPI003D1212A6
MSIELSGLLQDVVAGGKWEKYSFSEIFENVVEKVAPVSSSLEQYIGLEHLDSGSLHIKRFGDPKSLTGDKLKIYKGDYIFAKRNAYLKRVSLAKKDAIASAHSLVLRTKIEKFNPEFIGYFLLSELFWSRAIEISVGSLSPTINWKSLAKQEFLLPDKSTQGALLPILKSADTQVEKYISLTDSLSVLLHAKFKEHSRTSSTIRVLPVCELLLDSPKNGFSPKANSHGEGAVTVSIGAVNNGVFDPRGKEKYADVSNEILDKFNVRRGDVFIVRGNGNKNLCGRAGLSLKDYAGMFYPDLLIRLRFDSEQVLPEYAAFLWNTMQSHTQLLRSAKSTNGIWKVNGDDIKRHNLAVPTIQEQKVVLAELREVREKLSASTDTTESMRELFNSIINKIFEA